MLLFQSHKTALCSNHLLRCWTPFIIPFFTMHDDRFTDKVYILFFTADKNRHWWSEEWALETSTPECFSYKESSIKSSKFEPYCTTERSGLLSPCLCLVGHVKNPTCLWPWLSTVGRTFNGSRIYVSSHIWLKYRLLWQKKKKTLSRSSVIPLERKFKYI